MKIYHKAILPLGFQANGVACGIKKSGKLDLALFYSQAPAKAACKFTANKIPAAPLLLNKKYLKQNKSFRAILVNSGNANCFTGVSGLKDALQTTTAAGKCLGIRPDDILVNSTGIIGRRLPVDKIKVALPDLCAGLTKQGIAKAKKAILTTDTFTKEITVKFNLRRKPVTICGVAKGAGMIAPDMATMLCFIFTDANIIQGTLNKALGIAVDKSFNCITVDGCMSTNDSVMLLANGLAANNLIESNKNFSIFVRALERVCLSLAKEVVYDAEGASKFIEIKISGANNLSQAKGLAKAIANSNLFKTAVYGENPNFGRIVAALGTAGIALKEKDIKIKVSPLTKKNVWVEVCVGNGKASAVVYTSDLTPEYIKINAEYN